MLQPALAKSQLCRAMASACPPEELRLGIVLFIIKRPPSRLTHWYPLVQLVLLKTPARERRGNTWYSSCTSQL